MIPTIAIADVREHLVLRQEIALIDLRNEAAFATGHPLFASQMPMRDLERHAELRIPRRSTPIALYHDTAEAAREAAERLIAMGYGSVALLEGGLDGWRDAGHELFEDVNSYAKGFGELVEAKKHTPSLSADEVAALQAGGEAFTLLDVRRPDEHARGTLSDSVSVPGAELVLRGPSIATEDGLIVVHCAGRTRSIIAAQSLINAGVPNTVRALRNGTIGWRLSGRGVKPGRHADAVTPDAAAVSEAVARARAVSYAAGVEEIGAGALETIERDAGRTAYLIDVRSRSEYTDGHVRGFRWMAGGQLVQEIDMVAPVRGARIVLHDDLGVRSHMTASWLVQMGWECHVLAPGALPLDDMTPPVDLPPDPAPYDRPYVGNAASPEAMQAYLDWEAGLVGQLEREGTHGFHVI